MNQETKCYGVLAAERVCAANIKLWDTPEVQENMRRAPAAIARLEAIEAEHVAEREREREKGMAPERGGERSR